MKRISKAIAAIVLTVAVLCAIGCKKVVNGNDGGTAEGMYVGVIGFNKALYSKQISLLNSSSERDFLNFIEGLKMNDATALYHADNRALDWLQEATLPSDLINVSLVTFTDGLDNASLMLDDNYSSQAEFLNAVNNRIMNDKVQGKSINAYAIGMKGNDVVDEEGFRQNLRKLSSSQSNVFEVEDMDEATDRFSEIASQLYNESTIFGVSVKIPGGYDNNTVVRITFDNVSEASSSSRYIQATYSREGGKGKLSDISYYGLQSSSGTSITSGRQDGLCYWYTFMGLRTMGNEYVTDLKYTKLWRKAGSTTEWQPESEFTPSNYSNVIVERKSAVTVLVLDCTTSLGAQDFRKMKDAAKEFIRVLNDNSDTGGGNGGGNEGGHAYVDLGLPSGLLWATCNVGADNPEDKGDYFAWGETTPKVAYNSSTYTYSDNPVTLPSDHDAATVNWGGDWRMPTHAEWKELLNNTTVTWTTQNGVKGRLFTASKGNSLFLPAAGYRYDSSLIDAGSYGNYWSSSLYGPSYAWYFSISSGSYGTHYLDGYRCCGRSVRPVCSSRQN